MKKATRIHKATPRQRFTEADAIPGLPATTGRFVAVKTGSGRLTGYIEVFAGSKGYVTVPGASRWIEVQA